MPNPSLPLTDIESYVENVYFSENLKHGRKADTANMHKALLSKSYEDSLETSGFPMP